MVNYFWQNKDPPLPTLPRGVTIKQYYHRTFGEAYKPVKRHIYKKRKRIKVFLSHPNGNKDVMNKVHDFSDWLRKKTKTYSPWCDKDFIGKPGVDLSKKLIASMIQALEEADIVLVGIPTGPVSNWIIAENRQAKAMKKRILIVNFGKAKIKPGMVRSKKGGFLRISNRIKKWEEKILAALDEIQKHGISYDEF